MSAIDDRQQLEEKIYQDYSRDGMGETLMGIGLLIGSLSMTEHFYQAAPFLPIILIFIGQAWRKRITYPRLGYAEIVAKKRTTPKRGILLILVTALLLLAVASTAFMHATRGSTPLPHDKLLLGAIIAAIIAGAGIALRLKSVWVVAVLMLGFFAIADYWQFSAGWAMAAAGVIMLGMGLLRLRRFVRDNPVLEGADGHN